MDGKFKVVANMSSSIPPITLEVFELKSRLTYACDIYISKIEHMHKCLNTPNIFGLIGGLGVNLEYINCCRSSPCG